MPGRPTNEPLNYFAFGRQTAKDTEATTFFFLKHLDGTGFDVDPDIQAEREGGDGQEIGLRYRSFIKADGQWLSNVRAQVVGRAFAYTLGQDSYASIAPSYGTHDMSPVASLPYVTIEQRAADEIERVINSNFTQLELSGEAGRPLKLNVSFVGGGSNYQRDTASTLTAARETGAPLFFPGGTYKLDGTTSTKLTKFTLRVGRQVDDSIQTTGLTREDVVSLNLTVDLEGTLKYEDRTLYQKIEYNGGSIVPFRLATGSFEAFVNDGASTALQCLMPLLEYTDAKVNRLDPDGKTVYIDFTAASIKGATYPVIAKVTAVDVATSYLSAP